MDKYKKKKKKITFDEAFEKSKTFNPNYGNYIHMCKVLQASGSSKNQIIKYFNKYMGKDDYLPEEKGELIEYLFTIANDLL